MPEKKPAKSSKKRDLTPTEKKAQEKLKAAYEKWALEDPVRTQEYAADLVGINQSSLTHYINGRNPLNIKFLLKICTVMQASPIDIYPEAFEGIDLSVMSFREGDEIGDFVKILKRLSAEDLNSLRSISEKLAASSS